MQKLFMEIRDNPFVSIEDIMRQMASTIPSEPDQRDYELDEKPVDDSVNLMPWYGLVENQKNEPICVAQTAEAIARVATNKENGVDFTQGSRMADFNSLDFYYNVLKKHDRMPSVAGTTPRNGMKCLKKFGIAEVKPEQGRLFRIDKYYKCRNIKQVERALMDYGPVSACFRCFFSLYHCDGIIKPPKSREKQMGFHQMALMGYNEVGFNVVNSWGPEWANHGTALLPYELYDTYVTEAWAAK